MHAAAFAVVEIWSFQERSDPRVTPSIEISYINNIKYNFLMLMTNKMYEIKKIPLYSLKASATRLECNFGTWVRLLSQNKMHVKK